MTHIHDALYVGAPAAGQLVMARLLREYRVEIDDFIADLVALYRQNRETVVAALKGFGMEPVLREGAYYMMVRHNRSSDRAAMEELLERGIATAPGVPFYRPGTTDTGYLRVHFALSEEDCRQVQDILVVQRALA